MEINWTDDDSKGPLRLTVVYHGDETFFYLNAARDEVERHLESESDPRQGNTFKALSFEIREGVSGAQCIWNSKHPNSSLTQLEKIAGIHGRGK